jgi:8-oxo-dGTP pyrophosphatase MutT (NUDIX family)
VAALRELFEEAGVLLAEDASGALLDLSDPARAAELEALRGQLQQGRLSLADLARREGLRLAADRLHYFSRWITPAASPRRYDARFFLAELPSGQTAGHCQIETTDGLWIAPREALARHGRDEHPMIFVTTEHVKRLSEFGDTEALLAFAQTKGLKVVRPVLDGLHQEPYIPPEQRRSW